MNAYGYFAIIIGIALIAKAIFMNDLAGSFLALIPFWFAYSMYQPKVDRSRCTERLIGTISSVKWSSLRLNTEKTYNVVVEYGGVTKTFKQLPPEFSHRFSNGDSISVFANPINLKESYLDY